MKALKLKLLPSKGDYAQLDELFWKWASICNRIASAKDSKKKMEDLAPKKESAGLQFSKTQLHSAVKDVQDLREAARFQLNAKERSLDRTARRRDDIKNALDYPTNRAYLPDSKRFYPKDWKSERTLPSRYHTERKWQTDISRLNKQIERMKNTVERMRRGKIKFKPTRITIWQSSFRLNFPKRQIQIRVTADESHRRTIGFQIEPDQPLIGKNKGLSSLHGKDHLENALKQFAKYAIRAELIGMSDSERKSLKAKSPEKIMKRDKKISAKRAKLAEKTKTLEKWIERQLTPEEASIIKSGRDRYLNTITTSKPEIELGFEELIGKFAEEVMKNDNFLDVNKYSILIRRGINKHKTTAMSRHRSWQWEYFLQASYEDPERPETPQRTFMGIDRGITHLLAIGIFDPSEGQFVVNQLISNPVTDLKRRKKKLLKSITRLERRVRAQHNIHIHENQMKKNLHSIENRIDSYYHLVSKNVVNLAKKHNSAIYLESLERQPLKQHGRKRNKRMQSLNYTLSLFDYGIIAKMIAYKAKAEGITVFDVNPAYTSKTCARCLIEKNGKIHEEDPNLYTRDTSNSKIGLCKKHGQIDADLNASRVIALCGRYGLNDPQPFGKRK